MGLLQRALRESTSAPHGGASSLYARAIASLPAASAPKPDRARRAPQAIVQIRDSLNPDELAALESELSSIAPTHDAYLASWSKVTSILGLSSMALFMPRGDSLVPVARIGFAPGKQSTVPSSIAERAQGGRENLDRPDADSLCAALGASSSLPLRAVAVHSGSRLSAMWAYRDGALESSPRDLQARVGGILSSISSRGIPVVPILASSNMPGRILLDTVSKSTKASLFLFDLSNLYAETAASCPGSSPQFLLSSFSGACSAKLSGAGTSVICDSMRIACILGSTTSADHELALFQFGKSLKRFLPFLSVAPFPSGRSMSLEPPSPTASSEIDSFLAC